MKICLMSDLHLEYERSHQREAVQADHPHRRDDPGRSMLGPSLAELRTLKPDLVVLAGDIDTGTLGFDYARMVRDYLGTKVVYVPGNHEFYGENLSRIRDVLVWEEMHDQDIHVLDNKVVEVGGIRFIGSTLWAGFTIHGDDRADEMMNSAGRKMSDYSQILSGQDNHKFRPEDTRAMHVEAVNFLASALATPFQGVTIVVTHHAPSIESIPLRYQSEDIVSAYATDLSDLILAYRPFLWLHGHVHSKSDYVAGRTRILCNPRGYYPAALVPGFDPCGAIVDVGIEAIYP